MCRQCNVKNAEIAVLKSQIKKLEAEKQRVILYCHNTIHETNHIVFFGNIPRANWAYYRSAVETLNNILEIYGLNTIPFQHVKSQMNRVFADIFKGIFS